MDDFSEKKATDMGEWKLVDGGVITDEETERIAEEFETDAWEGRLENYRRGPGRPPLSPEPNANMSFKCPVSDAELIVRAAEACGVKKSAFLRAAACEKAAEVLGEAGAKEARTSLAVAV